MAEEATVAEKKAGRSEAFGGQRAAGKKAEEAKERSGPSKTQIALGAAGLLLFILGVKRTFRQETPTGEVQTFRKEEAERLAREAQG